MIKPEGVNHRFPLLHALMRRGLFGDEVVGSFMLFVGGEDLLFVVSELGVDFPRVGFGGGFKPEGGTTKRSNVNRADLPPFAPFIAKI